MKRPVFKGSAVAIVTPFTHNGVDYKKMSELCEYHIKQHTDAIVVAGTTGEASTMPDEEHLSVVRCVVETVNKRIPVIAGTGSNDTRHAVELSQKAAALGADALLCVTPYYNKTSQQGLYLHFKAVADAVDVPMILYNVPSRTNLNINPETAARLAELPNINGIKECRTEQAGEIAYLCGDNLNLYSGEDGMVLPLLSLGGWGVISVIANIVPAKTHDMVMAYLNGNPSLATKIQIELVPLIKAMFCDVNPIPVKTAMNLMGLAVGPCRMPLCEPSASCLELIRRTLTAYGLPGGC
ncbi:MAG: 4-hydroxy-tetrahydrodipicolinate synthase [Clostridiaceae bacterium]|nr:4-hydroxy-tetrahydrodipicolinate synthase [Clostridiaceae bacterium]